ncbi:MAG: hypothetical protein IPM48_10540 [Saprospiraceae bacterium]|nr:hypothetical protein [Saprospiraceae bacterium]
MQRYKFIEIVKYFLIILHILFIFNINYIYSQHFEYTGAIVIGQKEAMSYKIVYELKGAEMLGYSLSDVNGALETKCLIQGKYDKKSKSISFKEERILYSKSNIPWKEFCLMRVNGKIEKKFGKEIFQGNFTSLPQTPEVVCGDGSMILTNTKTLYEIATRVASKLDSVSVKDSTSQWIQSRITDLKDVKSIDEITSQSIQKFKWKSDTVYIDIWDDKLEDGDKVALYKNGEILVKEMTITNHAKSIQFAWNSADKIELIVKALSEGSHPPNTLKITLRDHSEKHLLITQLRKDEQATILLQKK